MPHCPDDVRGIGKLDTTNDACATPFGKQVAITASEAHPALQPTKGRAVLPRRRAVYTQPSPDIDPDAQNELYKETMLMTLARAADADINIQNVEVERVQHLLKEHTGEDFSATDIRLAARDELYAQATLQKYLTSVRKKLSDKQRGEIIRTLADVFRSDAVVSPLEVDFFNGIADSLQVTPAQIAGLNVGEVPEPD